MAKTNKDKQCYAKHIEECQTIPVPKPTRVLRCVLYNIVCPCSFWPWYCLTFFDVFCITLFVLVGFGHGIVWRSSMCFVLHCLSLLVLAMVVSDVLRAKTNKDKQCYTKHFEERQKIPWPKPTRTNNVMQNTSKNVRQYQCQNQQAMVLSDVLRCVLYNIVCPCWFWSWYCLTFFDVFCITWFVLFTSKNVRQYHSQNQQEQTML
jgi:hypothetical protein